jgi:hypothetical protein
MTQHPPLGVKLIAVYFCLKAAVVIVAVAIAHFKPELQPAVANFLADVVPLIRRYELLNYGVFVAPPFALLDLTVGLGIWHLRRWARALVVLDLSWGLTKVAMGLAAMMAFYREMLSPQTLSPYFVIELSRCILMFFYLIDPDVRHAFRVRE